MNKVYIKSITLLLVDFDLVQWVLFAFADYPSGDVMVDLPIALAISIYLAFVALVVVFDPAPSNAHKFQAFPILLARYLIFVAFYICETCIFQLLFQSHKILCMVLMLAIPPHN